MLEGFIKKYKKEIDKELGLFLDKKIREHGKIKKQIAVVLKSIREFNMRGGKRIRPLLVILGYLAAGGRNTKEAIKASVAVELLEAFLLIHDDIIDRDSLRRGKQTINIEYEKRCGKSPGLRRKKGDEKRTICHDYGNNIAIVAGDIALGLAVDALLETRFDNKKKSGAIAILNNALIKTCFGQILDINTSLMQEISEKDIIEIQKLKTAVYTIEAPLHIGAELAGKKSLKRDYSRYALHLGQAFQIRDDILNIFGSRKAIGKPIMSDIAEGKQTLLIKKAISSSGKRDAEFLKGCMGKKPGRKEIARIRQIIRQSSLDETYSIAKREAEKAKKHIENAKISRTSKRIFAGFADYIIERKY